MWATAERKKVAAIYGIGLAALAGFLGWAYLGHRDVPTRHEMSDNSIASTASITSTAVPVKTESDMDAKFIQVLDIGNIPYKNAQNAIVLAHVACADLTDGTYWSTTYTVTQMNPSWTNFQVGYLVGVAADAFCPDEKYKIPTVP